MKNLTKQNAVQALEQALSNLSEVGYKIDTSKVTGDDYRLTIRNEEKKTSLDLTYTFVADETGKTVEAIMPKATTVIGLDGKEINFKEEEDYEDLVAFQSTKDAEKAIGDSEVHEKLVLAVKALVEYPSEGAYLLFQQGVVNTLRAAFIKANKPTPTTKAKPAKTASKEPQNSTKDTSLTAALKATIKDSLEKLKEETVVTRTPSLGKLFYNRDIVTDLPVELKKAA